MVMEQEKSREGRGMGESSDEMPAAATHTHRRKEDKPTDKWTKPSVVIWRLIEAIAIVGMAIFGSVWASVSSTKDTVATHDGDIKVIKSKIEDHDKTITAIHQEQIETNRMINKILIYHGIKDDKK